MFMIDQLKRGLFSNFELEAMLSGDEA
jgi:hypothetical protein